MMEDLTENQFMEAQLEKIKTTFPEVNWTEVDVPGFSVEGTIHNCFLEEDVFEVRAEFIRLMSGIWSFSVFVKEGKHWHTFLKGKGSSPDEAILDFKNKVLTFSNFFSPPN